MSHYYNEIEPYAVAWLRNLMDAGHIPAGDIDTRSIEDVRPSDLAGYVQCHFFAGIGGWPLALALAGWPSDRPVWTGSCPCQPFSVAGKGDGAADKQHLWPAWFHLISQCRPAVDHRAVNVAHAHGFARGQGRAIDGRRDQGGYPESWSRSWSSCGSILGYDGKARRVEPSIRLLAHGLPTRVGRLRAYGNAIVPQVAAAFIGAYAEARGLMLEQIAEAA